VISTDFDLSALTLPQPKRDENPELGQEDFLELMIAQIRNQDPFEPVENGAFIAQLAQFSTVTGIAEISKSVASLSDTLLANQTIQASAMVGRTVLVEAPQAQLGETQPLSGALELPPDAAAATVRISDASGALVREFNVRGVPGALVDFQWDGVTRTGERAAPGLYSISAVAADGSADISVPTYAHVRVHSVSLDPSGAGSLITTEDGQRLRLSQVRAVM
jgi:flagellar basal-body rod modification protein FlgD